MSDPADSVTPPATSLRGFFSTCSIHPSRIVLWLIIQLVALGLSAARVPLWANPPAPVESVAAHQMVVVQMAAPAMLFVWLMPNLATGLCVILVSAPMLMLAGMLADAAPLRLAQAWVYVCMWLMALVLWSAAATTRRARQVATAVATALVIGVPVILYLATEFHHRAPETSPLVRTISPTMGALAQLQPGKRDAAFWLNWLLIVAAMAGAILVLMLRHLPRNAPSYPQD